MKPISVYVLSLGCSKNEVDGQVMAGALTRHGYRLCQDPAEAEIIMVNTCGFIEAAQQESIGAILDLAQYKSEGRCQKLLAIGCMAEKFAADMLEAMPELDGCLGVGRYGQAGEWLDKLLGRDAPKPQLPTDSYLLRDFSAHQGSAYLKIAEGCDNHCSYCLIPQLRGPYRSRSEEDILAEARLHAEAGVKELTLIAQDSTGYGVDLYGEPRLAGLLEGLAELPFAMIRLLYAYPERIDERLLQTMAEHENICRYLDIPIQHASCKILRAMKRPGDGETLLRKLEQIRSALPGIALRTTVMVGFPGETEQDFSLLLDFLEQARFDWLGAFPYYQEADTAAAELPEQVEQDIKQERLDAVLRQAAHMSEQALRRHRGQILTVLTEGPATEMGGNWQRGRSQYQAPEVDGCIYFPGDAKPGSLRQVRITDSDIFDLSGELI